jgi:hypothetical protein
MLTGEVMVFSIVTRPFVASSPEIGFQMPLRIRSIPPDKVVGAPDVCS